MIHQNFTENSTDLIQKLIGNYLTLSSRLDLLINLCFRTFIHDRPVMDATEKDAFDFKCRKLNHYLSMFHHLNVFTSYEKLNVEEGLKKLERDFQEIRRLRNFLAHSVLDNNIIVSSRRYKKERNGVERMNAEELTLSIGHLSEVVKFAEALLGKIHSELLILKP